MQSRVEDILQAMIDGTESSELPKPQSRNENLLLQVLDKMNEGGGGAVIDDTTVSTTKTWSSSKIDSTKLDANQGGANSGKVMGVDATGDVVPVEVEGGNITVTETPVSGDDYAIDIVEGEHGSVTSVAGKTGVVTLNGDDVSYSDLVDYGDGTVGGEIANLKSKFVSLANETTGYTRIITADSLPNQNTISKTTEFLASAGDAVTFEMDASDSSVVASLSTLFYNGTTLLKEVAVASATKAKWVATGNVTKVMIYCRLTAAQSTTIRLTAKFYNYYGEGTMQKTVDSILVNMQDNAEWFLQNLINTADTDYVVDSYINADTGEVKSSPYFNASGFIKLKPNTKYYVGGIHTSNNFAYYDEDKKYIAETPSMTSVSSTIYNTTNFHGWFMTGAWTRYIRVSILKEYADNAFISEYYDQYMAYGSDSALGSRKIDNFVTDYQFKGVLVIGDSISTGYSSERLNTNMPSYASYDKWVDDLIQIGYFPAETTYNCSQHATGFVQRAGSAGWSPHSDFYERLLYCENAGYWDKEDIDLVVVYGGINDYSHSIPIGDDETDYTVYFAPAVRNLFDYLLNNYTHARICVLTPTLVNRGPQDSVAGIQTYSDVIKNEARKRTFPVLDLTKESGFYPFNTSFKNMWTYLVEGTTPDGAHPNEEYQRKYLAPMIKHFLDGMA